MTVIHKWTEAIKEDVNKENSMFIETCGKITEFLYKIVLVFGAPYFIYLLYQFTVHF
ncbi:hypothetical protein [Bacillus sp. V3-13]|uniref:hypothetical protein n=1 Tax=Bacillus sp. V3-13 TaxID=2053728 RepID=UPI0015E1123E|nr:hypothetical protein [Bacillus sp. V3-13]